MRVAAQACVALQDVQVEAGASGRRSIGSDARVELEGEPESTVVVVYIRANDCSRAPIQRYLDDHPLYVRRFNDIGSAVVDDAHSVLMGFAPTDAEPNLYHVTLAQPWVNSTEVRLVVFTVVAGVVSSVGFTLVLTTKSFPVFTVVGAVIGVGLGVLLLLLLHILHKNRAAAKETLKAYMKFEFTLGLEIGKRSYFRNRW
jgi:hypothetical protein